MALHYLLDENLRGLLWRAIQRHNVRGVEPLDVVRVGDLPGLPLASPDRDLLLWAEREGRILISLDKKTLAGQLADHLRAGRHCPGVLLVRQRARLDQVLAFLIEAAYRSDPAEWQDRIEYLP